MPDTRTPPTRFRPPPVDRVRVDGFFGPRIDTVAGTTAHILLDRCEAARMIEQVDPAVPCPGIVMPFESTHQTVCVQMFWDSDLAKAVETAAYSLHRTPDPTLEARVDRLIDAWGRLQDDDGYLNSWYQRVEPGKRWTNVRDCHELYCAGHLMEAAVAWFQSTGKRELLDIMTRYADHIGRTFGTGEGQLRGYCGHPEIELALVRLGRATGEDRHLELARFFVDERGRGEPHFYDVEARARGADPAAYHFGTYGYCQAHAPVREQREVVGHAVRAAYLYAGMADVATEFDDDTLLPALDGLWSHLTERNLYVTGGFGPSAFNEGLTVDFDLPNDTAYAETCAAVSLVFWASRMLGRGPDARYADVMERALYNGALAGLSLDGRTFFYENPLESRGHHHRWEWHKCPCCPVNVSRLIASVGTYAYGVADDAIAVHLYCEGEARLEVRGAPVRLVQSTAYPYEGGVRLEVHPDEPLAFALLLRVPGWARSVRVSVNGEAVDTGAAERGYLRLERTWSAGDRVELELPMPVETVHADPRVGNDQGRVALMRGPLVYCLEGVDNGEALNSLVLADGAAFDTTFVDGLTGHLGIGSSAVRETPARDALYSSAPPRREPVELRAVPYHAWDNREGGEMLVWIRREGAR